MLSGANNIRFKELKEYLENAYTMGEDKYPKDCESLLGMMNNFRPTREVIAPAQRGTKDSDDGLQFAQTKDEGRTGSEMGASFAQSDQLPKTNKKGESACWNWGKDGHWHQECPDLRQQQKDQLHIQINGAMISQTVLKEGKSLQKMSGLNKNYLYLDPCTTTPAQQMTRW
jgi:hypothetical protein